MTTTSTEQKSTTTTKKKKKQNKAKYQNRPPGQSTSTTNPKIENSTSSLLVYTDSLEPQLRHVLMGDSFEANVRYKLWSRKEKEEWETYCDCRQAAKEMKEMNCVVNVVVG